MGESACLMQPFSYVSGISNAAKEGNPFHALGESISFGRFTSESLAWEKWSSFSSNRYVEEAAKYSRPGSVAQKKAFFEAHYKSIAARKAAALLEQANAAANNVPEPEIKGAVHNIPAQDSETMISNSHAVVDKQPQRKTPNTEADFAIAANRYHPNVAVDKLEVSKVERTDPLTERQVLSENFLNIESSIQLADARNYKKVIAEPESSETTQMETPLLKSSNSDHKESALMSKKKPPVSFSKSPVYGASKFPSSPVKPTATIHPRKEINATPISIKSTLDSWDRKRSTPKSLHVSVNITPAREYKKLTPPAPQKIQSSRVAGAASKATKDCSTPLRTPTTVSMNGVAKHNLATPQSENRRAKTPLHPSASGSKTMGPKWHFLSTNCSNSLNACRNKLQSPILSSPFSFKTEERAAKRKEKLEERFNAKEAQRVQLQTKFKEKAETELRKLRQSLCFKARPLPDFYKQRRTPKNQTKKSPVTTHPQSPKLGRKPSPSTGQGTASLPPQRPSTKSSGSKFILEKKSQTTTHSFTLPHEMITHENTSPNIQHW